MDHEEALRTNSLEGYVLNDLDPSEREEFEEHLFSCLVCAEEIIFLEKLREALSDDPEFGARFHTPHAAAAYVLDDLSPENRQRFEAHMSTCRTCARNVRLGQDLLKSVLEQNSEPYGTRLLKALRFTRWFRLVFGE